jgi:hypothetical protein
MFTLFMLISSVRLKASISPSCSISSTAAKLRGVHSRCAYGEHSQSGVGFNHFVAGGLLHMHIARPLSL